MVSNNKDYKQILQYKDFRPITLSILGWLQIPVPFSHRALAWKGRVSHLNRDPNHDFMIFIYIIYNYLITFLESRLPPQWT